MIKCIKWGVINVNLIMFIFKIFPSFILILSLVPEDYASIQNLQNCFFENKIKNKSLKIYCPNEITDEHMQS